MAAVQNNHQEDPPPSHFEIVDEIMRAYRSLPRRPSVEEVEAALSVVASVNAEEHKKLEEILKQESIQDVPQELFSVLREVRKIMVRVQSQDKKREANRVVELDELFRKFDEIIRRASALVSGGNGVSEGFKIFDEDSKKIKDIQELGDIDGIKKLARSSSAIADLSSGREDSEKFSLMKVAAVIENTFRTGERVVDLQGKLMEQVEWLPDSIGKLSHIIELNLSENRLMTLPPTITSLSALTKLNLHSNQLTDLPELFGLLSNLLDLDLHSNNLSSLPTSFGNLTKLVNLDLSSNNFTILPNTIGNLTSLKRLRAETNELEEIPYNIGSCLSLMRLVLDFNHLKALPEAIGKLQCLEVLTLHYNRIKGLPTTVGNLIRLRELDLSFNELENITENLCFAVHLQKLNVGKNFADLTALPTSIGNLEMLEELDISDTQIRVLPHSFRCLSNLRVLHAEETPLEVPPRHVVNRGAQAVVEYMENLAISNNSNSQGPNNERSGFLLRFCSVCRGGRRERD